MHHQNISTHSLNENLYDISIENAAPKKRFVPRRAGLTLSLHSLEQKRPSEYYLTKIGANTALTANLLPSGLVIPKRAAKTLPPTPVAELPLAANAPVQTAKRPSSNVSDSSTDVTKDSDDAVLVVLTPFDVPDSRLSLMTNYSTYLATKATDSAVSGNKYSGSESSLPSVPLQRPSVTPIAENRSAEDTSEDFGELALSLSTISLQAGNLGSSAPVAPKLRASSTSSVLEIKRQPSYQKQLPLLSRQASAASLFGLLRAKTRYYNPQETKERKQLRKKLYEENDADDELLTNDLDLVFNVPVIKNHGELYRARRTESVPNMLLSRHDIVNDDDNKNPYKPAGAMKPCPLPGKLSRLNLSVDRIPQAIPELRVLPDDIMEETDSSYASTENDSAICNNISEFYTQRLLSYLTLARVSRDQQLSDRMPQFVKTHSSVEDISLISPEKLEVVDQLRPINLPPKKPADRTKHNRELHRVITDFEATTKHANNTRKSLGLLAVANQQIWLKLMLAEDRDFERKLNSDREKLRKLNWDSLVSGRFRFEYFKRVLLMGSSKGFADSVTSSVALLESKINGLSPQMKKAKDAEFIGMVEQAMQRPLLRNYLVQVAETDGADFDTRRFRENFRQLLYFKTFSDGGLQRHHQVFIIPIFLILFQSTESFSEICVLIESFDREVLSSENLAAINKKLSRWSDLTSMSQSNPVCKILKTFSSLQEFESLSATSLFDIIVQLNDRLPLSLSAPSTPIVAQSSFRPLSTTSSESEGSVKNNSVCSLDSVVTTASDGLYSESSSLSLVGTFLQLLVIYSRSKNRKQKTINLFQAFLLTVFQYYHINWNSCGELVRCNKSIRLNNSSDQLMNLESFLDKWKEIFKKL